MMEMEAIWMSKKGLLARIAPTSAQEEIRIMKGEEGGARRDLAPRENPREPQTPLGMGLALERGEVNGRISQRRKTERHN